jgi:hypothetical protein
MEAMKKSVLQHILPRRQWKVRDASEEQVAFNFLADEYTKQGMGVGRVTLLILQP